MGFFAFANQSVVFPVIPLYSAQLGASVAEVGLIVGILSYSTAFLMIPCGWFSDRFGRRNVLVFGLFILSAS